MNETFYMVHIEGEITPAHKYENKEQAEQEAKRLSKELKKDAYILESTLRIPCEKEINEIINSLESACEYLNVSLNSVVRKHAKALDSLYALILIAEAWNKADDFIPDFSDNKQYKYFPVFTHLGAYAIFTSAGTYNAATFTYLGYRLCFKTSERAEQFGKQFIDLWNDFFTHQIK
jgi:hypothetical protein